MLSLIVKILAILTIPVAAFTKNLSLFFIAILIFGIVLLFDYLKTRPDLVQTLKPKSISMLQRQKKTNHKQQKQRQKQKMKKMSNDMKMIHVGTPLPANPMTQQNENEQNENQQQTQNKDANTNYVYSRLLERRPAFNLKSDNQNMYAQSKPAKHMRIPTLVEAANKYETRESRIGRARLLRQEIDIPPPVHAAIGLRSEIRRLAPAPAGPNMQRVSKEELEQMKMNPAPYFQRI